MRTLSAPVTVMSMDGLNAVDDKRTMFRKEKEKKKLQKLPCLSLFSSKSTAPCEFLSVAQCRRRTKKNKKKDKDRRRKTP